jgi:hypothetical protein
MSQQILVTLLTLAGLASSQRNVTIHGNASLGYYYIDVYVGTPPQRKSLIVDTGSRQTIMTCESCTDCSNHMNGPFMTSESNTIGLVTRNQTNYNWKCPSFNDENDLKCLFSTTYLEGSSYTGYIVKDSFVFHNEMNETDRHSKTHLFGCATEESGEFAKQAVDGIIGFGPYSELDCLDSPTLLEIEYRDKRIASKLFSICLGNNGGALAIGDWNSNRHLPGEEPKYIDASNVSWRQSYNVELSGIKVK